MPRRTDLQPNDLQRTYLKVDELAQLYNASKALEDLKSRVKTAADPEEVQLRCDVLRADIARLRARAVMRRGLEELRRRRSDPDAERVVI